LLLSSAVLALSACDGSHAKTDPELAAARQQWDDAAIEDYQFTLYRSCFCEVAPDGAGSFVITVKSGAVDAVFHRDSGVYLSDEQAADLPTIDDLFDRLDAAYRHGADEVEASYDPTLGYPLSIYIDRDAKVSDDEISYQISEFM